MDHVYAPDECGAFDDWTDFSVSLVDEESSRHKMNNFPASIDNQLRQTPSSEWKHDRPIVDTPEILRQVEFPEPTGDQHTLLDSLHPEFLHPISSGLNVPGVRPDEKNIPMPNSNIPQGLQKVKDRIETITKDMRESGRDAATSMKMKTEKVTDKVKTKTENTVDKVEDKLKSAKKEVTSDLNKLSEKTEDTAESIKDKLSSEWESTKQTVSKVSDKVSSGISDLNNKAKVELNELNKDLHEGVDKLKDKLSTQNNKPEVTVVENATVIVEDWDKKKSNNIMKNSGFFSKINQKLRGNTETGTTTTTNTEVIHDPGLKDYHEGPKDIGTSVKSNTSLDIPPKESDSSMLDMVDKQKQPITAYTTVTNKHSGGPWPASHIPSQMRVDQSQIQDIKRYPHQGYGQADKDYYGGNEQLHGTGNSNTSQ